MRLIWVLVFYFMIAICSCSVFSNRKKIEISDSKPEMYQASELALLMRRMHDDGAILKKHIESGTWPASLPDNYDKMHTAKATDPADINETYQAMADVFLVNYDSLKTAPSLLRTERFNNFVNACISCHKVYCNGPIPKIQGLLVK